MSSSIILGNHVKDMVVFVEGLYLSYRKKVNSNATYEEFLSALEIPGILSLFDFKNESLSLNSMQNTLEITSQNDKQTVDFLYHTQKETLFKFVDLIVNFNKFNDAQIKLYKDTIGNITRVIVGFTILLIIVLIVILVYTWILVNWYGKRDGTIKVVQVCIMMTIFTNIILTIYTYLARINKRKKRTIKDNYEQYRRSYNSYISFIKGDLNDIDYKEFIKVAKNISKDGYLSKIVSKSKENYDAIDNDKKEDKDKLKYSSEAIERVVIQLYYQKYIIPMVQSVFANGKGYDVVKILEMTGDDLQVYTGINEVFAKYYDMMLVSKQPDDDDGQDGIKETLNSFVINPLSKIDISGLEDTTTYDDKLFIKMLEEDENYTLLMSSFKYVSIFTYPLFKAINYNTVIQMEKDGTLKQTDNGDIIKEEPNKNNNVNKYELDGKDINDIVFAFQNDKAMKFVHNNFPNEKKKFEEELLRIEGYKTVPSLAKDITIIEEFINLSQKHSNKVLIEKYKSYVDTITSSINKEIRKKKYEECVLEFRAYFNTIFTNLLERKLSSLNPTPSQYFIYEEEYMKKAIRTLFDMNELDEMDNEYKELMIEIFVDKIVKNEKDNFIAKYGSMTDGSLKVRIINKLLEKEITIMTSTLSPFDIVVSNYSNYIKDGLMEKAHRTTPFTYIVTSKIDSILSKIDEEISKNKNRSNSVSSSRFIPMHSFIKQINEIKFSTLKNKLRLSDASQLMKSFTYRAREEENTLQDLKMVYFITVLTFVLGYVYYLLDIIKDSSWVKEQVKTGNFSLKFKNISDVSTQDMESVVNTFIKVCVPFFIAVMFMVIGKGYIKKKETNIDFNKEIMRTNTEDIQTNISQLNNLLSMLEHEIKAENVDKNIGDIDAFDNDKKIALYNSILSILVSFDKCNYIIGLGKNSIPFPHGEVIVDSIMIITILAMIGYIVIKFAPKKRVDELKELYEYQATAQMMFNDATFSKEILIKYGCFIEEWSSMMFAVKGVAAVGLVIFVLFYSVTISQATMRYKSGLYTSSYAKSKRCV
jgi:hypothetical protein